MSDDPGYNRYYGLEDAEDEARYQDYLEDCRREQYEAMCREEAGDAG